MVCRRCAGVVSTTARRILLVHTPKKQSEMHGATDAVELDLSIQIYDSPTESEPDVLIGVSFLIRVPVFLKKKILQPQLP